jgi:hypothetical protein
MKSRRWAILFFLFAVPVGLRQTLAQNAKDQSTYCEDGAPDEFAFKGGSVPKAVVSAVLETSEGKQARADAGERGEELTPEKVLRAARLHVSSDNAAMFLVMGSYPLAGADASWFWIVRDDGTKASVLLWMAGNCVELKESSTRGYRDIGVVCASAGSSRTESYHYDGKVYKLAHSRIRTRGPNE